MNAQSLSRPAFLPQGSVIVSVQAEEGEPFAPWPALSAMALAVLNGGASGLRMAGPENIRQMKALRPEVPLIGITKPKQIPANAEALVYITPTLADALSVAQAGADIVALDATQRPRPQGETLAGIVAGFRAVCPGVLLMADVATVEEGLAAADLGFDLLSTTLSGYTVETRANVHSGPDFALLRALVAQGDCPVVLEGRVWEPAEVAQAFEYGARAVVIGSAITRPHLVTRRFLSALS